jgi:hypothetical protein
MVEIKSWDSWWVRALRVPLRHRFCRTDDATWVAVSRSPYPYGPCPEHTSAPHQRLHCFVLTPLSVLHRWTGLTLSGPVQ